MTEGLNVRSKLRTASRYPPSDTGIVVAVCLVGVLLHSYPLLVFRLGDVRVFRPGWLLAIPLLAAVVFGGRRVLLTRSGVAALSFLVVAGVGTVLSGLAAPMDFLTVFAQIAYAVGLFVGLVSLRISFEEGRFLLRFWVVLLLVVGTYGIYQAIALNLGLPFADPYFGQVPIATETSGYTRPASVFREPSLYASALLTGISVLVPCVSTGTPLLFSRRVQTASLLVLTVALVTAASMTGFVTAGLSVALFLVVPDTRRFVLRILCVAVPLALLCVVAGLFLGVPLVTAVVDRLSRGLQILTGPVPAGGSSIHVRFARWVAGVQAWLEHPVFGTGVGQYETWAADRHFVSIRRWLKSSRPLNRIHGVWVQVPAMTGIVGLATFCATWLAVVRSAASAIGCTSGPRRVLCVAALSLVAVQLIDWSFGYGFIHLPHWVLIGIATSIVTEQIRRSTGRPSSPARDR